MVFLESKDRNIQWSTSISSSMFVKDHLYTIYLHTCAFWKIMINSKNSELILRKLMQSAALLERALFPLGHSK